LVVAVGGGLVVLIEVAAPRRPTRGSRRRESRDADQAVGRAASAPPSSSAAGRGGGRGSVWTGHAEWHHLAPWRRRDAAPRRESNFSVRTRTRPPASATTQFATRRELPVAPTPTAPAAPRPGGDGRPAGGDGRLEVVVRAAARQLGTRCYLSLTLRLRLPPPGFEPVLTAGRRGTRRAEGASGDGCHHSRTRVRSQ